jgi:hypothetical protein
VFSNLANYASWEKVNKGFFFKYTPHQQFMNKNKIKASGIRKAQSGNKKIQKVLHLREIEH